MRSKIRHNLLCSLQDGIFYSLMVGLTESYLAAFVIALGHAETTANLMNSLPLLAGAVLQLLTPIGLQHFKSYKKWILSAVGVQIWSLSALAFYAWRANPASQNLEPNSVILIFAIASLYWAGSLSATPAWNGWLHQLVPTPLRTSFFSLRTIFCQSALFTALCAGGLVLHAVHHQPTAELQVFAAIFVLAAIMRGLSGWYVNQHTDRTPPPLQPTTYQLSSLWSMYWQAPTRALLGFMVLFYGAIYTCAGFFTPFWLKEHGLSYFEFMQLIATGLIARIATLSLIRRLNWQHHLQRLFLLACWGIALLPWLWTLSARFEYWLGLQVLSGVTWATFELSAFLLLFNQLPQQQRAPLLSFYTLFQTTAMILCSAGAGFLFQAMGSHAKAYGVLFEISGLIRVICVFGFTLYLWHNHRKQTPLVKDLLPSKRAV